ncbi:HNHc domain-containing protein [Penicillium ucsense]|uniref:HNHc domain-containing protein n=1 Tax=Penicillium ucsense TaxID=2839758 RepID=A0A8J8W8W2_9EURO|nr:HNHc domain-containing protein [Penicillium ucsense]KAF7737123.1 HNHc domain-containing protein [Penicillium ucsense]
MLSSSKTRLDQKLNGYAQLNPTDKTRDFLRDFFKVLSPDGREHLADDVSECANDEQLRQLVRSIETGLLIPMKAQGGKTPTDITPSPRYGVEDSIENLKSQDIEPITRGLQSQLRQHCLERDGYKCVVTGRYSGNHAHPQNAPTTYLEAAHIIPFTLASFQSNDREAVDRHAKIWVNLRRYFPVLRQLSFTSEQINSEKNVLMLSMMLHKEFGQFKVIFEATGTAHQYRIKTFPDAVTDAIQNLPRNRLVRFRVHKGNWELPDPALLKIHACIGNFLHISGQAEIIDKVLKDFEDCGGLASDGSSNLEYLLAVSRLSLLPTNVNETPDSKKSTEKQRSMEKSRPMEQQGRQRAKRFDTENQPWGY